MYTISGRTEAETAELVAALRPVADAVRKKKYQTRDGDDRPEWHRVELHLSVAECKNIMRLVDSADFAAVLRAAG